MSYLCSSPGAGVGVTVGILGLLGSLGVLRFGAMLAGARVAGRLLLVLVLVLMVGLAIIVFVLGLILLLVSFDPPQTKLLLFCRRTETERFHVELSQSVLHCLIQAFNQY